MTTTAINEEILDTQYLLEEKDGSMVRITLDVDGTEKTISLGQRIAAGRTVMGIVKISEEGVVTRLHDPRKTQFPVRVVWGLTEQEGERNMTHREGDMMFGELMF